MDPMTIGVNALAIGSQVGGAVIARDAAREAAYTNALNADRINRQNIELQKEFAKKGIRWKVEDARQAGLSPLVALGAQTHSFAPSLIAPEQQPDLSMANAVSGMGQNISRAVQATMTQEEREYTTAMNMENLKNARLKNAILESQLSFAHQPTNPALPSAVDASAVPGQGNAVKVNPVQLNASRPGQPGVEAGAVNDISYVRGADGGFSIAPSKDVKERIEDQFFPELMWSARNQFAPFVGINVPPAPPKDWLPKGADKWLWNGVRFVPAKKDQWFSAW